MQCSALIAYHKEKRGGYNPSLLPATSAVVRFDELLVALH